MNSAANEKIDKERGIVCYKLIQVPHFPLEGLLFETCSRHMGTNYASLLVDLFVCSRNISIEAMCKYIELITYYGV
jgi:hypothetical protein